MSRFPALTNRTVVTLMVLLVLIILVMAGWIKSRERLNRELAESQLSEIYDALQRYETRNGALPVLAFYPLDPISGTDSIRYELARYLPDPSVFVSPNVHALIRKTGLTYVWNPQFNGARLASKQDRDWLLIDIQALRPGTTKAHRGGYLTLFSDGTIELLSETPKSLVEYQQ